MTRRAWRRAIVGLGMLITGSLAIAADLTPDRYEVEGRKSGYVFLSPATRRAA